jgi:DNA-directed RNA polymerase subunit N (RpoN/RPB10)
LQSFRTKIEGRRQVYLNLAAQIEGQLRAAYDQKYKAGEATQSSLADKLGVNRSCIHRRLMGHTNMTTETIADMVWGLDFAVKVSIFDPANEHGLNLIVGRPAQIVPTSPNRTPVSSTNSLPPSITHLVTRSEGATPISALVPRP